MYTHVVSCSANYIYKHHTMEASIFTTLYNVSYSAFFFFIILFIIVFIHELGHYAFAKFFGVKVEEFAIGFGKEIFGFNDKSGTRWKFCALPLGGYVKMFGDADPSSSADFEKLEKMSKKDKGLAFHHKKLWQKFIVIAAGPIANFVLAIFIYTWMFSAKEVAVGNEIVHVEPNTPAAVAGIMVGDKIVSINNESVEYTDDIVRKINLNLDEQMIFEIMRNNELFLVNITPESRLLDENDPSLGEFKFVGIGINPEDIIKLSLLQSFVKGTTHTYDFSVAILKAVGQMITGQRGSEDIGGPLRIAQISGKSAERGVADFFNLIALISINLGLINLFPIPLLDGGHLFFYLIEGLRGKPLNQKLQNGIMRVGFALIITLMIYAFVNDIRHFLA